MIAGTENKEQNDENIKVQSKEQTKVKGQKKELKKEKNIIINKDHQSVIKNFVGKDIIITLRNDNKLKGKLETVAQYELVITIAYNPIIVMKHAIDYIELAGEK